MPDYETCQRMMKRARKSVWGDLCRKLANHTYLCRYSDSDFVIYLHGHPVIIIKPGSFYILDSCGWKTVTTKNRINTFSPACLWQKNWQWFVDGKFGPVHFENGMWIDFTGCPVCNMERLTGS